MIYNWWKNQPHLEVGCLCSSGLNGSFSCDSSQAAGPKECQASLWTFATDTVNSCRGKCWSIITPVLQPNSEFYIWMDWNGLKHNGCHYRIHLGSGHRVPAIHEQTQKHKAYPPGVFILKEKHLKAKL